MVVVGVQERMMMQGRRRFLESSASRNMGFVMSRGNHGLGEATVSIDRASASRACNNHHHFSLPQSWDELSDPWTVATFLGRENVYLGRQGTPSSGPGFHPGTT